MAGIKVVKAMSGFVPAGTAAILLLVVAIFAWLPATAAAVVLGIASSAATPAPAPPVPTVGAAAVAVNVDMVLHSRPLLMVPVDKTLVVAATVAVAGVLACCWF